MNAFTLSVLLHYFWSGEQYSFNFSDTEKKAVAYLMKNELIKEDPRPRKEPIEFLITDKGRIFIQACLDMPLPEVQWVIPGRE